MGSGNVAMLSFAILSPAALVGVTALCCHLNGFYRHYQAGRRRSQMESWAEFVRGHHNLDRELDRLWSRR
jgi:hypothetical protein